MPLEAKEGTYSAMSVMTKDCRHFQKDLLGNNPVFPPLCFFQCILHHAAVSYASTPFIFCIDIDMLKDHAKVRGLAIGRWLHFHHPKSIIVHMEIPSLSVGTCLSNSRRVKF
uniref:Uncharacterized protein n=1 Tax=Zonotrichia albicollis TaxID=44394 RepID=A0A8D2N900_ZONAL